LASASRPATSPPVKVVLFIDHAAKIPHFALQPEVQATTGETMGSMFQVMGIAKLLLRA